jgi:catechol 2,3-dioxygenase-like lactoylglutathione lyase family enzyme
MKLEPLLYVTDLQKSIQFYRDILGFKFCVGVWVGGSTTFFSFFLLFFAKRREVFGLRFLAAAGARGGLLPKPHV